MVGVANIVDLLYTPVNRRDAWIPRIHKYLRDLLDSRDIENWVASPAKAHGVGSTPSILTEYCRVNGVGRPGR